MTLKDSRAHLIMGGRGLMTVIRISVSMEGANRTSQQKTLRSPEAATETSTTKDTKMIWSRVRHSIPPGLERVYNPPVRQHIQGALCGADRGYSSW